MTSVYNYRVYCIEEVKFVTAWGTVAPSICPNNHADRTIDTAQTTIIGTISTTSVTTNEPTTGHFQHTTLVADIPSGDIGDVSTFDFSWPMDLQLWKSDFFVSTANIGDTVRGIAAPNTQIGVLTVAANIGDTVLYVPNATVTIKQMTKGLYISLDDGISSTSYGRVTAFSTTANTITVETPLTQAYSIGAIVRMNIYTIRDMVLFVTDKFQRVGDKSFKPKILPANTVLQLQYTNNSVNAKTLRIAFEYYYT